MKPSPPPSSAFSSSDEYDNDDSGGSGTSPSSLFVASAAGGSSPQNAARATTPRASGAREASDGSNLLDQQGSTGRSSRRTARGKVWFAPSVSLKNLIYIFYPVIHFLPNRSFSSFSFCLPFVEDFVF